MTIQENDFTQRLRAGLPVLNPRAAQILRACEDPAIDFMTLAKLLGESPVLSARLLGLANSAFYCRGAPVNALPQAIQVLGLVTARGVAVGLLIGHQLTPARCPAFDVVRYWETSLLTAQLAQVLAPAVPADRGLPREAAYMAGLLYDIGLLALVGVQPDEMNALLAAHAADPAQPLGERLRARLGCDPRQAGGWLAEAWRLPAPLRLAMAHGDDPGYRGESWPLALLTGLCARRARGIVAGTAGDGQAAEREAALLAALGLEAAQLAACEDRLGDALDALRSSAGAIAGHAGNHDQAGAVKP